MRKMGVRCVSICVHGHINTLLCDVFLCGFYVCLDVVSDEERESLNYIHASSDSSQCDTVEKSRQSDTNNVLNCVNCDVGSMILKCTVI